MMVYVPRQFTIGVTPIDWYKLPPNSSAVAGAAKAGSGMDADTPAAARTAPDRNNPRRLIFFDGMAAPPLPGWQTVEGRKGRRQGSPWRRRRPSRRHGRGG